jgi:aminoglycoside/choline kinase family phosphotransferase
MGNFYKLSEREQHLASLLKREKNLTAEWYLKMSEQVPWKDGERGLFSKKFEEISKQIYEIWATDNAEWFTNLEFFSTDD